MMPFSFSRRRTGVTGYIYNVLQGSRGVKYCLEELVVQEIHQFIVIKLGCIFGTFLACMLVGKDLAFFYQ